MLLKSLCVILLTLLGGCGEGPLNNPYPEDKHNANVLYSAIGEAPKHLDPALSYNATEWAIIQQTLEPPLEYHYLKRPYTLIPLVAANMPVLEEQEGEVIYTITLKPGIYYAPHPAFEGKREMVAEDFVYQIKRLASAKLQSPLYGLLSDKIVGFKTLRQQSEKAGSLKEARLEGVYATGRYTYKIHLKEKYPQFLYWLATPFFAPIPWEVEEHKGLSVDAFPIGTGPYYITENNPAYRMVLKKNPYYRDDFYPSEGMPEDQSDGLLNRSGERIPVIDKVVFTLEKENISYWNKFLQGYYDRSGVGSDIFNQAIQLTNNTELRLNSDLANKGMSLNSTPEATLFYWGFNMLDPIVGGYSEKAKALRQAISMAINVEEYIDIFLNNRGTLAYTPLPPGIEGYHPEAYNPITHTRSEKGVVHRRRIEEAKAKLALSGFKGPLRLYLDGISDGGSEKQLEFLWLQKQLAPLNIQLALRATQYNRFQEKMRLGHAQLFWWGWHADYPDPENFLFLLYGPNAKAIFGGENASNYQNKAFDGLFETMSAMPPGKEREDIIEKMVALVQEDAPWIFGFYPNNLILQQGWMGLSKANAQTYNTLKYQTINLDLRAQQRKAWNQ